MSLKLKRFLGTVIFLSLGVLAQDSVRASSFASLGAKYESATEALSEEYLRQAASWSGKCSYVAGPLTTPSVLHFHQQALTDGGQRYFSDLRNTSSEPTTEAIRKERAKFSERFNLGNPEEPQKVDSWISLKPVGKTPNIAYLRLGPNDIDGSVMGRYYQISELFTAMPADRPYVLHRHWSPYKRGAFRLIRDFNYHFRQADSDGKTQVLLKLVCNTNDCAVGKSHRVAQGEAIAYCAFDKKVGQ